MLVLLARANEAGDEVQIPATALAQVIRNPARQVSIMRLLRQPTTTTSPLDGVAASFVGQVLGATATNDIADAHVVVCARRSGQAVVTSDPDDLTRLDPDVVLIEV